jgi:hypothetical protein
MISEIEAGSGFQQILEIIEGSLTVIKVNLLFITF